MGSAAVYDRYASREGERVGSLTFLRVSENRYDGNRLLGIFSCDCGSSAEYSLGRILNGKKRTHCGCQTDLATNKTHGMRGSAEYSSWQAMKGRCLSPSHKDYPRYGSKGVTVCEEWSNSFEAFFDHIGPRPSGTSLDRIDNTKGYFPGNVRWATTSEQAANRSDTWIVEIDGIQHPSAEAAAKAHGVSTTTIVRWCCGYVDQRRKNQKNQGSKPAKPGCRMWRKYAD